MSLKQDLANYKTALIIHHWDTDGIVSASLLTDNLPNARVQNTVPRIGAYQLTDSIFVEASKGWEAIIVADIRLPDSDFEKLVSIGNGHVILYDHHLGRELPGVFSVKDSALLAGGIAFPSTSWLVKESLGLPISLRSLLGIVGDKGRLELPDPKTRHEVEDYLRELKLDEPTLAQISDLLDSSARIGDKMLVEDAVNQLSKSAEDPYVLLRNEVWQRNAAILNEEIETQMLVRDELKDGIAVKRFHSKFDIVSAVARKMAWSGKYRAAVALNSGFLQDRDQLYVRKGTGSLDSKAIIRLAHDNGYSAGGKDEVVGTVLPKAESQWFLEQVLTTMVG